MSQSVTEPILVELGQERWDQFIDSIASWLRNVRLAQSAYRQMAEDTAEKIGDPRLTEAMQRIAENARRHEEQVDDLYALIDPEPLKLAGLLGEVTAKGRQALGDVMGKAGGAPGAWNDIRQLLLANLNAIGAFGAVEQLGLTLGLPELAQAAFTIVREKSTDQLVIEELMLELAPQAIMYDDAGLGVDTGHRSEPAPPDNSGTVQPEFPRPGKPDAPIVGDEMERGER